MAGKPPSERDVQIGKNLRRLRKQAGMTQRDLGDLFEVSAAQAQKFETGKNRLSYERAQVFSAHIGVSVDKLYEGVAPDGSAGLGESPQKRYLAAEPFEPAVRALVGILMTFDGRTRAKIVVILQSIIANLDGGGKA